MKVLQKCVILIKNLYLSKQYGARRLLPDKGRKFGSIDSLLKRIRKTCAIVQLPRQRQSAFSMEQWRT